MLPAMIRLFPTDTQIVILCNRAVEAYDRYPEITEHLKGPKGRRDKNQLDGDAKKYAESQGFNPQTVNENAAHVLGSKSTINKWRNTSDTVERPLSVAIAIYCLTDIDITKERLFRGRPINTTPVCTLSAPELVPGLNFPDADGRTLLRLMVPRLMLTQQRKRVNVIDTEKDVLKEDSRVTLDVSYGLSTINLAATGKTSVLYDISYVPDEDLEQRKRVTYSFALQHEGDPETPHSETWRLHEHHPVPLTRTLTNLTLGFVGLDCEDPDEDLSIEVSTRGLDLDVRVARAHSTEQTEDAARMQIIAQLFKLKGATKSDLAERYVLSSCKTVKK